MFPWSRELGNQGMFLWNRDPMEQEIRELGMFPWSRECSYGSGNQGTFSIEQGMFPWIREFSPSLAMDPISSSYRSLPSSQKFLSPWIPPLFPRISFLTDPFFHGSLYFSQGSRTSLTCRADLNSSRLISFSFPAAFPNCLLTQRSHSASAAAPMAPERSLNPNNPSGALLTRSIPKLDPAGISAACPWDPEFPRSCQPQSLG